ncbi:MAG: hypothetical protein NZ583_02240 [Desulfobacterota bacterium]|nr:hypothetical protein [Thermodesulfobacteriota bacterium]MDW8001704.1 hypothetical protein [Deltaproteobacteria bacterium]
MRKRVGFFVVFLIALLIFFGCERAKDLVNRQKPEEKITQTSYEKQIEELKKSLKADIKIKVKRDGKGNYSWEIQGRDVNEVLKVNEILKRRLSD